MEINGKNEGFLQKTVLSCDMFTTGYFVMCLLFFVPYVAERCGTLVMWFLPIACLLPFAFLPLFYMLVHRFDTLLFGRYHLVMPLAGFVAAIFFVIAWSGFEQGAKASCLVFFGAVMFATAALLYRYCAFSVRARLLGEDVTAASPYSMLFTLLGSIAAVGVYAGFSYYDAVSAHINTAYVLAAACSVLVIAQYLSTYYSIPRLTGKRVQSVKNVFRAFFSGLDLRTYFSALLFSAAFTTVIVTDMYLAYLLGFGFARLGVTAAAFVLCYAVTQLLCVMFVKHRSKTLSAVNLAVFCIAAALVVLLAVVKFNKDGYSAIVLLTAGLSGIGGAISTRQTKLRFLTIKPRITSGTVFILLELTACAAAAIALVSSALLATVYSLTGSLMSFVGGSALVIALAVAAFVCASKRFVRTENEPSPSYELQKTADLDDDAATETEAETDGESDSGA